MIEDSTPARIGAADILTLGFGTTLAMWAVGYVCGLPAVEAPDGLLGTLLAACLIGGGVLGGRLTPRGWKAGLYCGLLAGLLNLLILGSLLSSETSKQIEPSKLLWIPGALAASIILCAAGAVAGGRFARRSDAPANWPARFIGVALLGTIFLLVVGGAVTGSEAGLAVPDWPNSYGYNMFLFPKSRMTGGVYYEHTHRLLASLVGLTTLVLAVYTQFAERRGWVRAIAWLALLAVIVQGVMGGLRVTGRFTLSATPEAMRPSIVLAVLHGVFAQVFLCLLVGLRAFASRAWHRADEPAVRTPRETDRLLSLALTAAVLVQLVLGAVLRHAFWGLHLHITMAVVVVLLGGLLGIRVWGLHDGLPILPRLGLALIGLVLVQTGLGIAALVVTAGATADHAATGGQVAITTLHQLVGALILACACATAIWTHRLLRPAPRHTASPAANV